MALNICKLEIDNGNIGIVGIESLINLCKYNPAEGNRLYRDIELSANLKDDKGAVLYAADSQLTANEIKTLMRLSENFEEGFQLKFHLKPTPSLISHCRNDILRSVNFLISFRAKYKRYSHFFSPAANEMQEIIKELLQDEKLVLHIYKMQYNAEYASTKQAKAYFHHLISVALFSFAIANIKELKEQLNFNKDDHLNLFKVAFLFCIGALSEIDKIIGLPLENRKEGFDEENKTSTALLKNIELESDVLDAIEFINEHSFGVYDIVQMTEKNTWMANIVIIANVYLQEESGLFGVKNKLKDIIDTLNMLAVEKKLNVDVIMSFTHGLSMGDIFDFYQEIENLRELCNTNDSVPYPMSISARPTIFVCKGNVTSCQHFGGGTKAVSLIQGMDELEAGQYSRCNLTSEKLQEFYDKNLSAIQKE